MIRLLTPMKPLRYTTCSRAYTAAALMTLFLLSSLATAPAAAQDADSSDDEPTINEMLDEGAWALQFQIGENVTLNSFQGGTISAKRHTSATRAYRFGLSLSASYIGEEEPERDQNRQSLALDAQLVQYPNTDKDVRLYYGGGPTASFSRRKSFREGDEKDYTVTSTAVDWGVGVSGIVGAEWFVRRDISLSAEYRTDLRFERRTTDTDVEINDVGVVVAVSENPDLNVLRFSARGVRLGLSVYF